MRRCQALCVCFLIGLAAPFTVSFAASPQKLRVAYSSISANTLPLWIALDQALFTKHGIEVEAVYISGEPMPSSYRWRYCCGPAGSRWGDPKQFGGSGRRNLFRSDEYFCL